MNIQETYEWLRLYDEGKIDTKRLSVELKVSERQVYARQRLCYGNG